MQKLICGLQEFPSANAPRLQSPLLQEPNALPTAERVTDPKRPTAADCQEILRGRAME
jgi:hypothetical protein